MRREIVDWEFQAPDGRWLPANVPGCIHTDLLRHGLIPDPFAECNERELQWIGERNWSYRGVFTLTEADLAQGWIRLGVEGLDTFAEVRINGLTVVRTHNMFAIRSHLVDAGSLQAGSNRIEIEFHSAWRRGEELEAQHGPRDVWNGDASRVFVRKAQYHYGWDWGPTFITCGIWRPIAIEVGEVDFSPTVRSTLDEGTGRIDVEWHANDLAANRFVRIQVLDPDGVPTGSLTVPFKRQRASLDVVHPAYWGVSLGSDRGPAKPSLYQVILNCDDCDPIETRIGFRTIRLDQNGCFDFWVNGKKLFCGGANWIPADSFPTRVDPERYRELLTAAKEAGMSMVRVWGGGIYEAEPFYDICDELELLVWQDFMFACGMYPADSEFLEAVGAEATEQVRRLGHHPCLAVWCGNNEDYQIAGPRYKLEESPCVDSLFPARAIYENVLPEAVRLVDRDAIYLPGSPYGGPDANSPTIGDRHVWEVWHGKMQPYQDYPKHDGLFVSEFGMGSYPDLQTLRPWIEDRSIGSEAMRWHHKALGGDERIAHYLAENFPIPEDSETFAFYTQLVQAEAMRYAYEGFRRDGAGGALVWQLNDCWPAISWSIIDYDLRPKPAYYTIKRALRPVALSTLFEDGELRIAVMNATPQAWRGTVVVDGCGTPIEVGPASVAELERFRMAGDFVDVRLEGAGTADHRVVWREPFRALPHLADSPRVTQLDDRRLRIEAVEPTLFVWIQTEAPVRWTDNLLHLLPREPVEVLADRPYGRYRLWWYGGSTAWQDA